MFNIKQNQRTSRGRLLISVKQWNCHVLCLSRPVFETWPSACDSNAFANCATAACRHPFLPSWWQYILLLCLSLPVFEHQVFRDERSCRLRVPTSRLRVYSVSTLFCVLGMRRDMFSFCHFYLEWYWVFNHTVIVCFTSLHFCLFEWNSFGFPFVLLFSVHPFQCY